MEIEQRELLISMPRVLKRFSDGCIFSTELPELEVKSPIER
jgi:hypothetical protein